VTSLTGMPTAAACFLLPIGVVMYTIAGGIKATFLTDYVHTVMILIIIFVSRHSFLVAFFGIMLTSERSSLLLVRSQDIT